MSLWVAETFAQAQTVAVQTLLDRYRSSMAVLGRPGRPTGAATLLDAERGLFLAHADAVQGDTVQARLGSGLFRFEVVAREPRTSLVLLIGRNLPRLAGPAITVAEGSPAPNSPIVVLVADGGIPGTYVGGQKLLIQRDGARAVPASELRFETPPQLVAGALVLSMDGRLVGTMGATLVRAGNAAAVAPNVLADVRSLVQSQAVSRLVPQVFANQQRGGPQELTVAYTPSVAALQRTINGFLFNKDSQPEFAGLGLQIAESPAGVVVVKLFRDSPASRSGIQVGDVLLAMDGHPINRQYDFLQALLLARPGDKMNIRVRHDGTEASYTATLARTKG